MKRLLTFLTISIMPVAGWAQTSAAPASAWDDPMLLFYVVVAFIFVVALLVLVVAIYLLQVVNILAKKAAQEQADKLGVALVEEPSYFSKLWDQINALRPMEKESELVLDHNYDGITELDNHLPPWWRWLFYVSILFAVVYLLVYHVFNTLPLSGGEYANEVAYANEQMVKLKAANPEPAIAESSVAATTGSPIIQALPSTRRRPRRRWSTCSTLSRTTRCWTRWCSTTRRTGSAAPSSKARWPSATSGRGPSQWG